MPLGAGVGARARSLIDRLLRGKRGACDEQRQDVPEFLSPLSFPVRRWFKWISCPLAQERLRGGAGDNGYRHECGRQDHLRPHARRRSGPPERWFVSANRKTRATKPAITSWITRSGSMSRGCANRPAPLARGARPLGTTRSRRVRARVAGTAWPQASRESTSPAPADRFCREKTHRGCLRSIRMTIAIAFLAAIKDRHLCGRSNNTAHIEQHHWEAERQHHGQTQHHAYFDSPLLRGRPSVEGADTGACPSGAPRHWQRTRSARAAGQP